jgi:hypothetical protein
MGMRYVLLMLFSTSCFAGDWTTADTAREGVYVGLTLIDGAQTRWFLKHNTVECAPRVGCHNKYAEQDITGAFGSNKPSVGKVDNLVAASIVAHAAIAYALPPKLRHAWQYIWIGVEAGAVRGNHLAGVKLSF